MTERQDSKSPDIRLLNHSRSPADYPGILPDFTLTMGQSCAGHEASAAKISLNSTQYSYFVEEGPLKGNWVIAFTVLDGIGGLLVGSTFTDLLFTKFSYATENENVLRQDDMFLFQKIAGEKPASLTCVSLPEACGRSADVHCRALR